MDGYHFDDLLLNARGWRPWKGAPHTFDVGGLRAMLERLRANQEDEIAVPVFDRALEIARAGARVIPRSVAIVIVVEELPIVADRATGDRALHETMSLAREHRLTAYDAAYLELAMRLGLPLATGDRKLAAAAKRAGVVLVGGTR